MTVTTRMKSGDDLFRNLVIHDYEYVGHGGSCTLTIGSMGSGKTTLNLKLLQRVTHLDNQKITKSDYLDAYEERQRLETRLLENHMEPEHVLDLLPDLPCGEVPETVVYFGREFDYWHAFLEPRSWPGLTPKKVRLHIPKSEKNSLVLLVPFENGDGKDELRRMYIDDMVQYYANPREIISYLQDGAINVIYPPRHYKLPDNILSMMNLSNLTERERNYTEPGWLFFEILILLMREGYKQHYSVFADEIHDIIPMSSAGMQWKLVDLFTRFSVELRRCQISLFGTTHDMRLVDAKYTTRNDWYIWAGGANPLKKYSVVYPAAVRRCRIGRCIIERKQIEYGYHLYERIPYQLPKLRAYYENT